MSPLLQVSGLSLGIGRVDILHDVGFEIGRGEAVGLVGESGSGKSMTALAIMGLEPDGVWREGSVTLDGTELPVRDDAAMSGIRGRRMAMVFQEPMTALDPVRTIGHQVGEGPRKHLKLSPSRCRASRSC